MSRGGAENAESDRFRAQISAAPRLRVISSHALLPALLAACKKRAGFRRSREKQPSRNTLTASVQTRECIDSIIVSPYFNAPGNYAACSARLYHFVNSTRTSQ